MSSPWHQIPLADYEAHMASPTVDQAGLLCEVFSTALRQLHPASVAVIGCAGGNGFDCIDPKAVSRVVGVDINSEYRDTAARRYAGVFQELLLDPTDIAVQAPRCQPVDLIYAALVFEYVEVQAALKNLFSMCRGEGHLVTVLQLPSASTAAVTPTAIPSIGLLASVMKLVEPAVFQDAARGAGFALREADRVISSAGKQFAVHLYQRPSDKHR